jgi:hypothetical protein
VRKKAIVKIADRKAWRPVYIEWIDASAPATNGWKFPGDLEAGGADFRCCSLGWIIGESRTHYTVAAHVGNLDTEDEVQFTGVMHIPRGMVVKLVRVKVPKG